MPLCLGHQLFLAYRLIDLSAFFKYIVQVQAYLEEKEEVLGINVSNKEP